MTDKELKELVASLAVAQKETDRQIKETAQESKETDRRQKETDQLLKETDRLLKENAQQLKETDQQMKETDRRMKETDQQIKELGKQIGGLGNKFGDFAEVMAIPSLIEILAKRFGATQIIETKRIYKGDDELEMDLIAASNGHTKAIVAAEVKSVLNQRELDKFIRNLRRFFEFFPQWGGYKLYGVLAAVESSKEMDAAAVAQGISVARMHGEIFRLKVPPHFEPKDFSV